MPTKIIKAMEDDVISHMLFAIQAYDDHIPNTKTKALRESYIRARERMERMRNAFITEQNKEFIGFPMLCSTNKKKKPRKSRN